MAMERLTSWKDLHVDIQCLISRYAEKTKSIAKIRLVCKGWARFPIFQWNMKPKNPLPPPNDLRYIEHISINCFRVSTRMVAESIAKLNNLKGVKITSKKRAKRGRRILETLIRRHGTKLQHLDMVEETVSNHDIISRFSNLRKLSVIAYFSPSDSYFLSLPVSLEHIYFCDVAPLSDRSAHLSRFREALSRLVNLETLELNGIDYLKRSRSISPMPPS